MPVGQGSRFFFRKINRGFEIDFACKSGLRSVHVRDWKGAFVNAARCAPPARSWPQSGRQSLRLGSRDLSLRKARFAEIRRGVASRARLQAAFRQQIQLTTGPPDLAAQARPRSKGMRAGNTGQALIPAHLTVAEGTVMRMTRLLVG